jgi:hypothetical protein
MSVRAMLARVQRLEQARRAPRSPIEAAYGSLEAWEASVLADVEAGKLDARDMLGESGDGGVLRAIRSWHDQGVFGMWQRDRIWEFGG